MSRTAIIILNWNNPSETIRCIESLLVQKNIKPDLVVVDNASTDDSIMKLEQYISETDHPIYLVKNKHNSGFSGGINTGIKYCLQPEAYDYIGLLNPDAVADEYWLSSLLAEFVDEAISSATGKVLSMDKSTVDTTGDLYTTWGIPEARDRDLAAASVSRSAGYVFGATGGAVLYRASIFEKVGLFDEKFFMYYEDVDFAFRCNLAGYRCRFTPDAVVYHDRGSSSKKVPGLVAYHTLKNMPHLLWKNVPLRLLPAILIRFAIAYPTVLFHAARTGHGIVAIKAVLDSMFQFPSILADRFKIQSSRKISSKQLRSYLKDGPPDDQTGLRKLLGMKS